MGEGEEGEKEGEFPGTGGFFEDHDFGVVGSDTGHEEGEAIAGGAGAGQEIGCDGGGAFGADFDDGGKEDSEGEADEGGAEVCLEGGGIDKGSDEACEEDAEEDPAQDHAGFHEAGEGHFFEKGGREVCGLELFFEFGEEFEVVRDGDFIGVGGEGAFFDKAFKEEA